MDFILLLSGFIILLISGDYLVRGAVSLAGHFKVSTLVVGMTVVSFGTSAPELVVSLKASLSGHADFSTGTVVGSNISNVALVLGLTALILPLAVNRRSTLFDWPLMFGATILLLLFILDKKLSSLEGLLFIALLISFIIFSIVQSRKQNKNNDTSPPQVRYSPLISFIILLISGTGLKFGADFLVEGATGVASKFGISDYVISVSVVAFGTSVPELATSAIAAFKKEMDISIGNIIGSNLFNILGILGITALIKPIPVNQQILSFDIYWLIGLCILLFLMMLPVKGGRLTRLKGGILVLSYVAYLGILFSGKL